MKKFLNFVIQTFKCWLKDDSLRSSAALSFYLILALPALIISLLSLGSFILDRESVRGELIRYAESTVGHSGEEIVNTIVPTEPEKTQNSQTIVGLVVLFFSASGIFGQLQNSLNRIWNVELTPTKGIKSLKRTVANKILLFAMVIGLGILLLGSFFLESLTVFGSDLVKHYVTIPAYLLSLSSLGIGFFLLVLTIALVYKYLPTVRMQWLDVLVGAIVTAVLFTLGKYAIGFYLGKATFSSFYGTAGSLVIMLVWVYYSALVFFLGAEFTQNYANTYGAGAKAESGARSSSTLWSFIFRKFNR